MSASHGCTESPMDWKMTKPLLSEQGHGQEPSPSHGELMRLGRCPIFASLLNSGHSTVTDFTDHGAINHLHRSPIGCVGLITPWNLPLYLLSWKVAPALLMGNTIVSETLGTHPPDSQPPCRGDGAHWFPRRSVQPRPWPWARRRQAIVEHPDIRGVSFTGGTATGKIVAATAAPMFKKLSLELGGKNATVVLDDAPLDEIMDDLVRASFTNSGQVCRCGSRILVDASRDVQIEIYEAVESITVGDPSEEQTSMGSVISHDHRGKVESYIRLAVRRAGESSPVGPRAMPR